MDAEEENGVAEEVLRGSGRRERKDWPLPVGDLMSHCFGGMEMLRTAI